MVVYDLVNIIAQRVKIGITDIMRFGSGLPPIILRAPGNEPGSLITEVDESQLGPILHKEVQEIVAPGKDCIVIMVTSVN